MKLIAIGDIHGRSSWKEIVKNEADKVIFIGDYFDSYDRISGKQQIDNFREILDYKEANKDKVTILIGNHDFHYMGYCSDRYSGYQSGSSFLIGEILLDAIKKDLMQMSFIHDTYLFTHAGVTKTWAENYQIDTKDIQNSINSLFNRRPQAFKFAGGPDNSPFGDDLFQTPIWVRPDSLLVDMIEGYTQVVGHTSQSGLSLNNKLVLIDTLGTSEEYLVITDGKMSVKNINKITMEEPELVWNKPSAFPFVVRDVSVWVPQIVTVMEVTDVMWGSAGELLVKGPTLFDTFEKGDKKSFAFRMVFQSYEKTLTDDEVNGYVADVVKSLEQKGWEVRR